MATEDHVATHLGGRFIRIHREDPEADPQRSRRRGGHPRELTATHHADEGDTGGVSHVTTLPM
jgi:hypothetical protein